LYEFHSVLGVKKQLMFRPAQVSNMHVPTASSCPLPLAIQHSGPA
jgi:hypothetical protein